MILKYGDNIRIINMDDIEKGKYQTQTTGNELENMKRNRATLEVKRGFELRYQKAFVRLSSLASELKKQL